MAPERRLIPPEDPVRTARGDRAACSANVAGVVPPRIHGLLSSSHGDDGVAPESRPKGRVDDSSSGLSFLLGEDVGSFTAWEHSTQTLNEELVSPAGLCVRLTHPEHSSVAGAENANGDGSDLLVACLGPNGAGQSDGRIYGRDNRGRTLRHVYAASPSTGVLCVWVLDTANGALLGSNANADFGPECDASVRLKLKEGELLTSLVPVDDEWLLASTSQGRVIKIYKTSRPLTLAAKPVKRKMIVEGDSESTGEEEGAGIVGGLYNYLFTPSKKAFSRREEDAAIDEGLAGDATEAEDIVALVPLPPAVENEGGAVASTASGRSPVRTPGGPSPRKQQRISVRDTSCARALSVSSSLSLKLWNVSLHTGRGTDEPGSGNGGRKEGYTSKTQLFPRRADGTLDLSSLRSNGNSGGGMEDGLEGYSLVDMMAAPSLCKDGSSLLAVVRIAKENDVEGTRAYIVRISLGDGSNLPFIMDAAWLDRYSGRSLSRVGGTLECAGLVAAEAEDGNGGAVAYAAFGPSGGHAGQVTVSAVSFASLDSAGRLVSPPRIKDLDLNSSVVPSAVPNSLGYDSLTGGCVLLASSGLLCGAHVRFPSAPLARGANISTGEDGAGFSLDDASLEHLAQDEAVLTIKSHLQSAFRQYLHKLNDGSGSGNPAREVVPPSVGTCPSDVLSAAAVLASRDLVRAPATASASPFSPSSRSAASPVMVLRDKLQSHADFVTFLLHAGAYRRISTGGRVRLRDHGEMLTAMRALLIECQSYFSKAEAAGDDSRREELARARQMVNATLEGAADDVFSLAGRWAGLQQLSADGGRDMILLTSSSICQGIGQALRYRQDESSSRYDIPSYDSSSSTSCGSLPWTSSREMLEVLFAQLQAIQHSGGSILSSSLDYDAEKANLRRYVEDMSASALSGHRDIAVREPDNDEAVKSYDETKMLAVPLLRQYANDGDDNGEDDDLTALQTSLAHAFFEGIVQICHDHRKSWRYQGPFASAKADERYALGPMMSNASSDSPYAHLHGTRDYRTGLSFCEYVLRWYAARGYYPEVFELGKNCPHDLTRYVRNDDRLSNLAWIQHLRDGGHEQATVGLLSLSSPLLFGDKQQGDLGLWEKDLDMSLAKLSNKLAAAKSANPTIQQRADLIQGNLTLVSAQKILQKDTELGDEIALKEDDLLSLAVEKISASRDVDEIKQFGICGLGIAATKPSAEAIAGDASAIWQAVIEADSHTWQSVANENNMSLGGISEEELIRRVEGTAFVAVMCDFVAELSEGKMQNAGFTDQVRNQVMHLLGSDELDKVLSLSAHIVAAAN